MQSLPRSRLPFVVLGLVLALMAALAARPVGAQIGHIQRSGSSMGPAKMISQMAFVGYYDAHKDTYLSTDVSTKGMASSMHVNYAPGFKHAAMGSTDPMYLIAGRAAAGQLAVFGSEPGEADYSPLWHEVIVKWKASAHPVLLTSDNQIFSLQKKGKLTLSQNHVILNCPIVKVGKG
jgi:hypothetical protein